jgi:ABC-type Fe3+ transport system substrate-binding protein
MKPGFIIVALLALILALPFVFREDAPVLASPDVSVVVITPHTESIRTEFALGFEEWYRERTGKTVYIDYRVIGGTSEIAKFLESEYYNSFRLHWTRDLGREWTLEVQEAFQNARIELDDTPEDDTLAEAARRAFLASEAGCGIDVFFGGGAYDFSVQAGKGNLIDGGLLTKFPEWFQKTGIPGEVPDAIPQNYAGETYYDAAGRWYGACLSSYGIIFNRTSLRRLGIERDPTQWADLIDPRLFGQIAVCDPTKSGSMTQAFEMVVQQQMQVRLRQLQAESPGAAAADLEPQAIREGWAEGMRIVQLIAANARYFTDTSQKPNIDVAMGDCAAGMSIDFYGRFQQENVVERSGDKRFGFTSPVGGTTISADPIGLLRGARNREVAEAFLEYVLSLEGQKLWNFEVGAPGGPRIYALRRPPIRPQLYDEEFNRYRSDADFNPYEAAAEFQYRGDWTGRLFSELRTIIRICFIDVRSELVEAWAAILEARAEGRMEAADRAYAVMSDLSRISYDEAATTIDAALKAPQIEEVRLARELSGHFRAQFQRAQRIAEGRE